MEPTMWMNRLLSTAAVAGLALLAGCQKQDEQAAPAFPPSQVAVVTTKTEELPITNELPGRIAATRIAEVRPRVTGIIVDRVFQQGSMVKEGEVLYKIDPAPFQVQVDSAEATLARAKAVQLQARQAADRQTQLRKSGAAALQQYDDAIAQLAQADADVAVAEAGLATAKLNLQYASVTAPISGRIGRALITEGALVSANGTENLATIQQLDPVYADFTQPAGDLLSIRREIAAGRLDAPPEDKAKVELIFDDGSVHEKLGKLLFSSTTVDSTTGQVTLRAEFPNPNRDLLPGLYVRVRIEQAIRKNALSIPQRAVLRDATGAVTVYVVGAENKAEARQLKLGPALSGEWIVEDGLKAGDKVIVEGSQKLQPGAVVAPEEWKPAAQNPGQADATATQPAK